jgi:Tol biopolymer transport system component
MAPAAGPSRSRISPREIVAWSAVALLVVAVAGLFLAGRRDDPPDSAPVRFTVDPPAGGAFFFTVGGSPFALSPDGRRLVFVSTTSGGPRLWVRAFDQSAERPLSGTEGAAQPFWSPDGTAVGFFADGRLKRIGLESGSVQVLADAPVSRGGTWSREGVIVYGPMINSGLMRVPANGGTPAPVTTLSPGEVTHRWPHFLPDGRRFLYLSALGQADLRGAFLGSLDGGTPRRVMNSATAPSRTLQAG